MIVGPAVVVPLRTAAEAAGLFGRAVRRARLRGPVSAELERVAEELEVARRAVLAATAAADVAATGRDGGRGGHHLSVAEYAQKVGKSERTIRHRCAAGSLDAVRDGKAWLIRER